MNITNNVQLFKKKIHNVVLLDLMLGKIYFAWVLMLK